MVGVGAAVVVVVAVLGWAEAAAAASGHRLQYNAWYGLEYLAAPALNNATFAASAGFRTVGGHGICQVGTYAAVGSGNWYNSTELKVITAAREALARDISVSRASDLAVWTGYEALSFPERLVEAYAAEMVDPAQKECIGYHRFAGGCISFERNKTREVFRALLDEVFELFPEIDGITFRYGENSPCKFTVGNAPWDPNHSIQSLASFINVLRAEICVERNRTVVFRTWDTDTSRFHSNRTFYEAVTALVEPHPRLVFSIKHTELDFWRSVNPNPTIGAGSHPQVIEACVGNLFQGMGAYPSYGGAYLINGYPENAAPLGFRDYYTNNSNFAGLFPVTQGAFTFPASSTPGCDDCERGIVPYPWVWPRIEFEVLAHWANEPWRSEEDVFEAVVGDLYGFSPTGARLLRRGLLLCMEGNLQAETVPLFDRAVTRGRVRPSANFMIYNSLGGLYAMGTGGACNAGPGAPGSGVDNACEVIPWVSAHSLKGEVVAAKASALNLYEQAGTLFEQALGNSTATAAVAARIRTSVAYGKFTFDLIRLAFSVVLEGFDAEHGRPANLTRLCEAAQAYNATWLEYRALRTANPAACPTLYEDSVWDYQSQNNSGIGCDVRRFQALHCGHHPPLP